MRYHSLGHFLRTMYGRPVWKVSVDAGCGCPNVDGTTGVGGCIFCNIASFSPSRRLGGGSITDQIDEGTRRLRWRHGVDRFLAYFQPATNTYGPLDRLVDAWAEAVRHPAIVGLIVGTRPDCAPDDALDALAGFSKQTWVSVEYGLQTIHNRSLDWLNRSHRYEAFDDAVRRSQKRQLHVGAHVILGLPGESPEDIRATARQVARLGVGSVKLHNLYVAKGTPLAEMWTAGQFALAERDEYVRFVVDFVEALSPDCVVDRLSADAPQEYLIAPTWCLDKSAVRRAIEDELVRRDTWQGRDHSLV